MTAGEELEAAEGEGRDLTFSWDTDYDVDVYCVMIKTRCQIWGTIGAHKDQIGVRPKSLSKRFLERTCILTKSD